MDFEISPPSAAAMLESLSSHSYWLNSVIAGLMGNSIIPKGKSTQIIHHWHVDLEAVSPLATTLEKKTASLNTKNLERSGRIGVIRSILNDPINTLFPRDRLVSAEI